MPASDTQPTDWQLTALGLRNRMERRYPCLFFCLGEWLLAETPDPPEGCYQLGRAPWPKYDDPFNPEGQVARAILVADWEHSRKRKPRL